MRLNVSQIKDITMGAVRVSENEDGIQFYRFTSQQEELYKNRNADFYMKSFAASGIRLQFRTNSQTLALKALVTRGSSRTYFAFDIFVNGEKLDSLKNFSETELPCPYTQAVLPLGEVLGNYTLGIGEKDICIYFPWSVGVVLKELAIDDGAFIEAQKPAKKMLCYGDSITQGYDALYPSNKYITRFAELLDAEEYNKAIGGEVFFPDLAATREDFEPDYITVAYGTNDWYAKTRDEFYQNCSGFFRNLTSTYPNVNILVITPIWRKDCTEYREFGQFDDVEQLIKDIAEAYENITVISGFDYVEHDESVYADLRLHPNDEGFKQYFDTLARVVLALAGDCLQLNGVENTCVDLIKNRKKG